MHILNLQVNYFWGFSEGKWQIKTHLYKLGANLNNSNRFAPGLFHFIFNGPFVFFRLSAERLLLLKPDKSYDFFKKNLIYIVYGCKEE